MLKTSLKRPFWGTEKNGETRIVCIACCVEYEVECTYRFWIEVECHYVEAGYQENCDPRIGEDQ